MNIDKAIDELQNQCCVPNSEFQKPEYQARALGIEALKGIVGLRRGHGKALSELLLGETKD